MLNVIWLCMVVIAVLVVIILRLVIGSSAGDVTDAIMKLVSGGK